MSDAIPTLTRSDVDASVRRSDRPAIVVFTAEWAENVEAYKEVLDDLQDEFGESIALFQVDVDDEGRLANDFHIADVPTFIGFMHGDAMYRVDSTDLEAPEDARQIAEKLMALPGAAA